ncbi:ATP-dependent helicase HrpA [Nitzschia inconspicua]|uniref:ATP-dependent helicase HrpA n=1 Tax=Nitzschia inconspicua TaxID=303405 RepID=A0A9K3PBS9_9STRA|nr:ATP-dependent helicase HrpA [Nitzschia inconspicua]
MGDNQRGQGDGRSRGGRGRGRGRSIGRRRKNNPDNPSSSSSHQNSDGDFSAGRSRGRGRGRGGGRIPSGRNLPRNESHSQAAAKKPPPPPSSKLSGPPKKNGEKGAEAHTVSELERIKFTKILMNFREDDDRDKMEFSSDLTNTERKFIHLLASQLGLTSKSTGKGDDRHIIVSKRNENKKKTTTGGIDHEELPVLNIGRGGMDALSKHLCRFPPTHTEDMESRETGASLLEAMQQHQSNNIHRLAETLQELNAGTPREAAKAEVKVKHVDLQRRIARHGYYQQRKTQQLAREYQVITNNRAKLPVFARQDDIVATVATTPVTIIQADTGAGKSTQCPQFLLDANPEVNIAVTQPRRISAISIAERVAQEQCLLSAQHGESAPGVGSLVGYQVRLETAITKDTQLLFLTPGVLLRKLQSSPMLAEYTHIIIDEVHERDKYTEFLLIRLRDLLPMRPDLRLILMSATIQTEVLMNYFTDCSDPFYSANPPIMFSIEGRTFPVQEFFLEHVLELTNYIDIEAMDEAEDGEVPPMSMDQLDAALAKLVGIDDIQAKAALPKESQVTVRCAICGKGFLDPAQLGEHIATCTGFDDSDAGDVIVSDQGLEEIPTANFSIPGMYKFLDVESDDNLSNNDENLEEYEDYDIDAIQEVVDYPFQDVFKYPIVEEVEEAALDKWDGVGEFETDVVQEAELSPKQEKYLQHYQAIHDDDQIDTTLLLEVLHFINKSSVGEGAVLVFLPGWQEISEVTILLESTAPFNNRSRFLILPLHSGIPSSDQRKVLRRPPQGIRKIVLSTNIAETSLTIDDVAFVVDTGRAKEKDYDPHLKTSTLQPTWISQSSSKQRKGRAGRTKAGVCFHLFSSRRYLSMRPFVESELLRTPLEEMCLMSKKLNLAPGGPEDPDGIPAFLSKAMTPPHEKSVTNALELLVDLGAMLPETNDLTTLGECLSVLSLEPRVGKMVIWSYLLGCTRTASQMAVAMSYKSPFVLPPASMRRDAEIAQLKLSDYSESDQVTVLNAIMKRDQLKKTSGEGGYRDWCRRNYLSPSTLQMIADLRRNLSRELSSLGYADPMINGHHNRHDKQHALWQAAIAAGLYPNVATRQLGDVNFSTMDNRKAKIHVSSVNAVRGQPLNSKCQIPDGETEFVCYGDMVKGSHFFTLSQTTHLPSPLPLLLLCGTCLSIHPANDEMGQYSILNLDDWIIFQCRTDVASSLVVLRKRLESAFWNAVSDPRSGTKGLTSLEQDAIETLGTVLKSAFKSAAVR